METKQVVALERHMQGLHSTGQIVFGLSVQQVKAMFNATCQRKQLSHEFSVFPSPRLHVNSFFAEAKTNISDHLKTFWQVMIFFFKFWHFNHPLRIRLRKIARKNSKIETTATSSLTSPLFRLFLLPLPLITSTHPTPPCVNV